jgi:hypothetical protein
MANFQMQKTPNPSAILGVLCVSALEFGFRISFGPSTFGFRVSDFRAADLALSATRRTLEQPCSAQKLARLPDSG